MVQYTRDDLPKGVRSSFENGAELVIEAMDNANWSDRHFYGNWLAQSYHLVASTTRFAALTAGHLELHQAELHGQMLEHLSDETGHEKLAFNDLKALGFSLNNYEMLLETRMMLQSQHYFISRSAIAHLGFILVLEDLAVQRGPKVLAIVKKAFGARSATFIDAHAKLDPEHSAHVIEAICEFAVESRDQSLIEENIEVTSQLYRRMVFACRDTVKSFAPVRSLAG